MKLLVLWAYALWAMYPLIPMRPLHALEKIDSQHRYGTMLNEESKTFKTCKQVGLIPAEEDFFEWVEKNASQRIPRVIYLTAEELAPFKATFNKSKVSALELKEGVEKLIYTMDELGIFYLHKKFRNLEALQSFQHSSFFSGEAVAGAGYMKFNEDQEVTYLDNSSGHYRPSAEILWNTLFALKQKGVDLEKVEITVVTADKRNYNAQWFFDNFLSIRNTFNPR